MSTCHCDGPPHAYDPSWCGAGRGNDGRPIRDSTEALTGALHRYATALATALLEEERRRRDDW